MNENFLGIYSCLKIHLGVLPPEGRNKNWLLPANSFSTRPKYDYFVAFQWRIVQFNTAILFEPLQRSH